MITPSISPSRHAILAALMSLTMATGVHAAPAASSVVEAVWDAGGTLFWSSDSGQTLTWGAGFDFSQSSVAQSSVSVNGSAVDSDTVSDFSWTDIHVESSYAGAAGTMHGAGTNTGTQILAESTATATAAGEVSATGYGAHAGRFTVHGGPGILTFSFPYTYEITVSRDSSDQAVYGYARPFASLDNYGADPAHNPRPYVPLTSVYDYGTSHFFGLAPGGGALHGTLNDLGLMTLSLFFNAGDKGYFAIGFNSEASAYTPTAPVPLPGAGAMLGLALAGLAMMRRREDDPREMGSDENFHRPRRKC